MVAGEEVLAVSYVHVLCSHAVVHNQEPHSLVGVNLEEIEWDLMQEERVPFELLRALLLAEPASLAFSFDGFHTLLQLVPLSSLPPEVDPRV